MKIGKKLKTFSVMLQDGSIATLPEKGKKYILFFYPKDNTPACTDEACSIRDGYKKLTKLGYEIYGASVDSHRKHQNFIKKYNLPYPLIADIDRELVEYLGLWVQKKLYGREYMGIARTTILIDENGKISHIIEKVDTKNAAEQILDLIRL